MNYKILSDLGEEKALNKKNVPNKNLDTIISFMMILKKKQYEHDPNMILKDLFDIKPENELEENVIHFIKQNIGIYETENMDHIWKNIQIQFMKRNIIELSEKNYEVIPPDTGKIYKKIYKKSNNELRYCMATCIIGFYNPSLIQDLVVKWGENDIIFNTIVKKNEYKSALDNYTPFFINQKSNYTNLRIFETTHDNFYILYCWLPYNHNKSEYNYQFEHEYIKYKYMNGQLSILDQSEKDKIPPLKYILKDISLITNPFNI